MSIALLLILKNHIIVLYAHVATKLQPFLAIAKAMTVIVVKQNLFCKIKNGFNSFCKIWTFKIKNPGNCFCNRDFFMDF